MRIVKAECVDGKYFVTFQTSENTMTVIQYEYEDVQNMINLLKQIIISRGKAEATDTGARKTEIEKIVEEKMKKTHEEIDDRMIELVRRINKVEIDNNMLVRDMTNALRTAIEAVKKEMSIAYSDFNDRILSIASSVAKEKIEAAEKNEASEKRGITGWLFSKKK